MNNGDKLQIINVETEDRLVNTNYRDEYKYTERLYDSIYEFKKGEYISFREYCWFSGNGTIRWCTSSVY